MQVNLKRIIASVAAATALAVGLTSVNIVPVVADEMPMQTGEVATAQPADTEVEEAGDVALTDAADADIVVKREGDTVTTTVEAEEVESSIDVSTSEDGPLDELIQSVRVEAVVDGEEVTGELNVDDFTYMGDGAFAATLTDRDTGELIEISSADVNAQAFPALYVLGLLARIGIKAAIKHIGKTQIKKAAKSYVLKQSKKKWGHIMALKHKWNKVDAKSKEQVAEIMGKAMAHGKHSRYKSDMQAVYKHKYKGKTYTVVVTYAKKGGYISNGWIR